MVEKKPDYERFAMSHKWIPTKMQRDTMGLISEMGRPSKKDLQKALKIPSERLGSRLATLVAKQWICRVAVKRDTFYAITECGTRTCEDYDKGTLDLTKTRPASGKKGGLCEKCLKKAKGLIYFAGKNLCESCLNPDSEVRLEDILYQKSPTADCQEEALLKRNDFSLIKKQVDKNVMGKRVTLY
mgnify:CR=1 FL=1